MASNHVHPDDPLELIQKCVTERRILWTYHVNMRLKGRFISRQAIVESYLNYEIIEQYPEDKYFPSYLLRSEYQKDIFHILYAVDAEGDNVRNVTAYRPDPEQWDKGFRNRRQSS